MSEAIAKQYQLSPHLSQPQPRSIPDKSVMPIPAYNTINILISRKPTLLNRRLSLEHHFFSSNVIYHYFEPHRCY